MEPERWQKVAGVFQAALDCEPADRAAFLETACAGDPPLLREVESLFASYNQGAVTKAPACEEDNNESYSLAGHSVGSYKIVREIGRGGMGAVYLASRADQMFE